MENIKNIDGIKKLKTADLKKQPRLGEPRVLNIDSIIKRSVKKAEVKLPKSDSGKSYFKKSSSGLFIRKIYSQKKVPIAVAVLALIMAFVAGMWSVLDTKSIIADTQPQVLGAFTNSPSADISNPAGIPLAGGQLQSQNSGTVGNDVLFNTPIEYLQSYFQSTQEPDIINRRKNQLQKYLTDMHSPLAPASETIAEQAHWKLILAIAFAESTLGKNCADNNCSNIGVKPGAPSWRQYASYSAWVVDFNRLLDKKYSDWTLEQMCGVYVKPCNPNWLVATQQILDDLKEQGIE